jgi:hypothetical protein
VENFEPLRVFQSLKAHWSQTVVIYYAITLLPFSRWVLSHGDAMPKEALVGRLQQCSIYHTTTSSDRATKEPLEYYLCFDSLLANGATFRHREIGWMWPELHDPTCTNIHDTALHIGRPLGVHAACASHDAPLTELSCTQARFTTLLVATGLADRLCTRL